MSYIKLNSAAGGSTGLGKITRLIAGMPTAGLLGLWLYEDEAAAGQPMPDVILDRSGNGNHLSRHGVWAPPVKRSHGIDVTDLAGMMYDSPIEAGRPAFTFLVALKVRTPGSEAGVALNFVAATANNYPANPAGASIFNDPFPTLNFLGSTLSGSFGVYDHNSDILGNGNRLMMTGSQPIRNEAAIIAVTVDGPNNTIRIGATKGVEGVRTDPLIGAYFSGAAKGNFVLGCWPQGTARTAASPQAEIYASALYDGALDATRRADAMARLRAKIEARGVVFA